MSNFWSAWIIVLTLGCCLSSSGYCVEHAVHHMDIDEGQEMDHEFDGIVEVNNPLPKWWTYLFGRVLLGLRLPSTVSVGKFDGLLGWKSSNQDAIVS